MVFDDLLPLIIIDRRSRGEHLDIDLHLEVVLVRTEHHYRRPVTGTGLNRHCPLQKRHFTRIGLTATEIELTMVHGQHHMLGMGWLVGSIHPCTVP